MRSLLLALLLSLPTSAAPAAEARGSRPSPRLHLVELFTSEGCSSCPPADRLLGELSARADVVALSFHVTYWDRLGWRDPYSSETATDRQRGYARQFELASLYTPQMIVDGREQFVGSDRRGAARALSAATTTRGVEVSLADVAAQGTRVSVVVNVEAPPADAELFVVWADQARSASPDRGENAGARLRHHGVVRELIRPELATGGFHGEVRLTRPEAVPGAIVAWVQKRDSGAIYGVARASVGDAGQFGSGVH